MICRILSYHRRYRASLRPIGSIDTAILIFSWTLLIFTKVFVYVISFANTPAFFILPGLIHYQVASKCFKAIPGFKEKPYHEKCIFLFMSTLIPTAFPSQKTKSDSMKIYNIVNYFLYFVHNIGVLIFAILHRHYWPNEGYCHFYEEIPKSFLGDKCGQSFTLFAVMMMMLVLVVTLLCCGLLCLYSRLHPRYTLFKLENIAEVVAQVQRWSSLSSPASAARQDRQRVTQSCVQFD